MGEAHLRDRFPSKTNIHLPKLTKCRDDLDLDAFLAQRSPSTPDGDEKVKAKGFLLQYFSDDDLQELCFDMGLDYDNIAGKEKRVRVMSLITYCRSRSTFEQLMAEARKRRPQAPW